MRGSRKALRALIIGLDGATFDLLVPMTRAGWMPSLGRVLDQGSHGVLRSTIPPLTAPAWTSFLTGMSPGAHGVFSFQRRLDSGFQRAFVDSTAIHSPRLWHWLARHNLTTGSINVPMTWPPHPMPAGSYVVTGMLTPSTDSLFTDPPELAAELRSMGYVCDLRVKLHERDVRTTAGITAVAQDLLDVLRRREAGVFNLLQERPTDVLAVVFETPDRLQHWAWQTIEELLASDRALTQTTLHEAVEACYRELDRVVGRLLDEAAGPATSVFFLSDHGFGPLQRRFHVDQWLAQQRLLKYETGKAGLRQYLRGPLRQVRQFIPRSIVRRGRQTLAVTNIIDWRRTQAYSGRTMEHAIYINLKGREPQGSVSPEAFDHMRRRVVEGLLALRDPRTGMNIVNTAYLREELYRGPFTREAPDILFVLAPGYEPTSELSKRGIVSDASEESAGIHQPNGIFLALGPGIRAGTTLPARNIEDVLPTVLYALGLPVSSALDGRIIKAAFEPGYLASHPPVYDAGPPPDIGAPPAGRDGISALEAAQVEERLAALGYLD